MSLTLRFFAALSLFFLVLPARAAANESIPTPDALAGWRCAPPSQATRAVLPLHRAGPRPHPAGRRAARRAIRSSRATLRQIDQDAHLITTQPRPQQQSPEDAEKLLHDTTYRSARSAPGQRRRPPPPSRAPSVSSTSSTTSSSPRSQELSQYAEKAPSIGRCLMLRKSRCKLNAEPLNAEAKNRSRRCS